MPAVTGAVPLVRAVGRETMNALMQIVILAAWIPAISSGAEAVGGSTYQAYWLTNKALGEYVKLVLTRRPLSELPNFSPATNQPLSDCDALIVTTYARDSIWNVDQKPFKPLVGVETVESNRIVINGESYVCTQARLEDVVRLLRDPMGKIKIHRTLGPLAGQEEPVKRLLAQLEHQLSDKTKTQEHQNGATNRIRPIRSETDRAPSAAGSRR